MKNLYLFLFFPLLYSCSAEDQELEELLAVQAADIDRLENEIRQADEFVEVFTNKYDAILLSLDSVGLLKDSLEMVTRQGKVYDDAQIADLQRRLNNSQASIDELRRRLADQDDGNATIALLRSELRRAQQKITNLETTKRILTVENDSIKNVLVNVTTSLAVAREDAQISQETLESTKGALRTAKAERARAERVAQIAEQKAVSSNQRVRREKASIFFQNAEQGFIELDTYVQYSRNGRKITINKKGVRQKVALQEARAIALQIYRNLTEASKLGHPEAEGEIYRLQQSPKYAEVAPN